MQVHCYLSVTSAALYRYGLHYNVEMMMSLLQEVKRVNKKIILHYTSTRKTSFHAKFQSKTGTVIELFFFMKNKNHVLPVFHTSCDIFIQFFCMQLLFCMFSTLISLKRQIEIESEL